MQERKSGKRGKALGLNGNYSHMKLLLTILFVIVTKLTLAQDYKGRLVLGEEYAKEAIKKAIADKNYKPFL